MITAELYGITAEAPGRELVGTLLLDDDNTISIERAPNITMDLDWIRQRVLPITSDPVQLLTITSDPVRWVRSLPMMLSSPYFLADIVQDTHPGERAPGEQLPGEPHAPWPAQEQDTDEESLDEYLIRRDREGSLGYELTEEILKAARGE